MIVAAMITSGSEQAEDSPKSLRHQNRDSDGENVSPQSGLQWWSR